VDTRSKILTAAEVRSGPPLPRPLLVATGCFDVLRAWHARELRAARERTGAAALLVAVLPAPAAVLDQRARLELVAALRVVDYVVSIDDGDANTLVEALQPAAVVRLEAADARLTRQLIEDVQRRQIR